MTMRASCSIRFLGFVLAGFLLTVSLPRSFAQVQLPVEKVPTFLGIDLPLRPGETVVPIGRSNCSAIEFQPRVKGEFGSRSYELSDWVGGCRFGLAHGIGMLLKTSDGSMTEASFVYGVRTEVRVEHTQYGGPYPYSAQKDQVYGPSASYDGFDTVRYRIYSASKPSPIVSLNEVIDNWDRYTSVHKNWFSESGNYLAMGITVENVQYMCNDEPEAEYSPFEKEIKKACAKKKTENLVVLRREGDAALSGRARPIVWLKSCPLHPETKANNCGALFREALGLVAIELDQALLNDADTRINLTKELLDRFAALEASVDARAANYGQARGSEP